ncbi:MAG TPA: ABC transporter permease [Opitutaceae bacterium]|jgi:putative ABC transport system permease protein
MKNLIYEFVESVRIAVGQIRANKMRSALTALGVVIGIVAVTLMGTAIAGINVGFDRSLAMLGEDVLYVNKWPWAGVEDWWNYADRRPFVPADAVKLNRMIASAPDSLLSVAIFGDARSATVRSGSNSVSNVFTKGTTAAYSQILSADFSEGRLFNDTEDEADRQVVVLGYDVAQALFPGRSALGETVRIQNQPFEVIGVLARQGSFLGLFSFDNQMVIPLGAYRKFFGIRDDQTEIEVKVTDKTRLDEAREELTGYMRRVRGQVPGQRDSFSVNGGAIFKEKLDPIKQGIALAGIFVTGLSLFVGAIGIMNITFVSVKERTKEIGTRKALGARFRTILLQFLIEAVSICFLGGVIGLVLTWGMFAAVKSGMPNFPIVFSPLLVVVSMGVSIVTGVVSGFAPAFNAARLDPVVALRYE